MLPTSLPSLTREERRLLRCWRELGSDERRTLLAFADFLHARAETAQTQPSPEPAMPQPAPRPDNETVMAAIKRLAAGYPMLDRALMLNEISGLMSEHLLHGRPAAEVIDALEALFDRYYQAHRAS